MTNLDDISAAIGELRAEVRGLRRDVQGGEQRATEHRANIHRRVDDLVEEVGGLNARLAVVEIDAAATKHTVAAIKPVADDVVRLRQQAIGAGTLGHWLVRIGIGVVTAAGWAVAVYTWLTGKPPP